MRDVRRKMQDCKIARLEVSGKKYQINYYDFLGND